MVLAVDGGHPQGLRRSVHMVQQLPPEKTARLAASCKFQRRLVRGRHAPQERGRQTRVHFFERELQRKSAVRLCNWLQWFFVHSIILWHNHHCTRYLLFMYDQIDDQIDYCTKPMCRSQKSCSKNANKIKYFATCKHNDIKSFAFSGKQLYQWSSNQ